MTFTVQATTRRPATTPSATNRAKRILLLFELLFLSALHTACKGAGKQVKTSPVSGSRQEKFFAPSSLNNINDSSKDALVHSDNIKFFSFATSFFVRTLKPVSEQYWSGLSSHLTNSYFVPSRLHCWPSVVFLFFV